MQFDEQALQTVRETRLLIDQYDAWLFDTFSLYAGQRIIEIGCGLGNHIQHFLDRELVVGIDISKESIDEVRHHFADHPNVEARHFNITDAAVLALRDMRFDTAVSVNVFEHIEDDELALAHARSLLQPNGTFILIVPAHTWLYGTMDSSIGHYRRYSKAMLKRRLEKTGFNVILQKYVNALGALGWLVNGRLLKRHVPPTSQLRILNRIVPIVRTCETHINPPFGVSVLSIARTA